MQRSATSVLVSVLIPLHDHRNVAERSIRTWCREQTLDRERYELIVVAPDTFPKRALARIRALLAKHDRVLAATSRHDVSLVAEAARAARGELLMFSESHAWPAPDLLTRCIAEMEQHPEWAGMVCGVKPFTVNRLGEVEADMYRRDFTAGSTKLRWRNINDVTFLTRRAEYFAAGGFDDSIGHFAEWVLGARYATEGFVVGQCPDIEMWHLYTGDLGALRGFTEDFIRGEITYLARNPALRRESHIEAPSEWSSRGDRRRDLARCAVRLIAGEVVHAHVVRRVPEVDWRLALRWLAAALAGGRLERVRAALNVLARRVRLFAAQRFARKDELADAFERYIAAVIYRARLEWSDAFTLRRQPAQTGELWNALPEGGDAGAGFHDCEYFGDVPFRWSRPVAVIGLDLRPGSYVIHVNTLAAQLAASSPRPAFSFNGRQITDLQTTRGGNAIGFRIEVAGTRGNWLGMMCPPASAPNDARLLGLPLVSVLATVGDP